MSVAHVSFPAPGPESPALFADQGFLVVPGLAGPERVRAMRAAAEADLEVMREPLEREADLNYPGAPAHRTSPGGQTVRRLLRALDRGPVFRQWALSEEVLAWVRVLAGSQDLRLVQAHHNCIMTKHPRFSSATFWHQDIRYWSFARNELINAWTALSHETLENGCMRVIPGSHRMALGPERYDERKFFRRELDKNRSLIDTAVPCVLAPGDTLFFHSGALHAAGRNTTGERKLAVVFTYRTADNRPQPGTRSASLPEIDPMGDMS